MSESSCLIRGYQVYTQAGIRHSDILITDGKIVDVGFNLVASEQTRIIEFAHDAHVLPGFIDILLHGAGGADVMDGDTLAKAEQALHTMSRSVATEGVTGFLAGTMSETSEKIINVVRHIKSVSQSLSQGAAVLGIYLEGPFLAPIKTGAQRLDALQLPSIENFQHWQQQSDSFIKIATVAPELAGAVEFIRALSNDGVVVSLAHSDADFEQAHAAFEAGARSCTHLFNAMSGLSHREPGLAAAMLADDDSYVELIADNLHVHPVMQKIAWKTKGRDRLMLTTDAMRAKGCADGQYELGGQTVTVCNDQACLPDGTLAGSVLTMNTALKNFMSACDITLEDAWPCTSLNAARLMGLDQHKGLIAKGYDADLVVLDDACNVLMTIVGGVIVHNDN